jgi:hypothetical protein
LSTWKENESSRLPTEPAHREFAGSAGFLTGVEAVGRETRTSHLPDLQCVDWLDLKYASPIPHCRNRSMLAKRYRQAVRDNAGEITQRTGKNCRLGAAPIIGRSHPASNSLRVTMVAHSPLNGRINGTSASSRPTTSSVRSPRVMKSVRASIANSFSEPSRLRLRVGPMAIGDIDERSCSTAAL